MMNMLQNIYICLHLLTIFHGVYNWKMLPSNRRISMKSHLPSISLSKSQMQGKEQTIFKNIYMMSDDAGSLRKLGKQVSALLIESPSMNSRRITASIVIDSSMDAVWAILTDYNNLAKHVPNLVQSYLVPNPQNKIRLFQEGAQKIIGFDFRASLVMDMTEEKSPDHKALKEWKICFKLIESRMFDSFDGQWTLRYHSRVREFDTKLNSYVYSYKTKLSYTVFVKPKGPVPVMALEWRIKEDIPLNLYAVKVAAEKLTLENKNAFDKKNNDDCNDSNENNNFTNTNNNSNNGDEYSNSGIEWGPDETLGSYIPSKAEETSTVRTTEQENKKRVPSSIWSSLGEYFYPQNRTPSTAATV